MHMALWILGISGTGNGFLPDGTKPLPESSSFRSSGTHFNEILFLHFHEKCICRDHSGYGLSQ